MGITRRDFVKQAGLGAVGLGLGVSMFDGLGRTASAFADQIGKYKDHNLVFVSFDAVQAAHVHAFGYPQPITPTIDAVSRQGYKFDKTISVSSWTVPASMTWFAGVYPCEHKLVNKFSVYAPPVEKIAKMRELAPSIVTLAEILKKNGYATGGFTGDAGVSAIFGYGLGFDTYVDNVKFGGLDQSVPKAIDWLKQNKDKKFFMFLHGYDAHGQHVPAGGYDYRFVDKGYDYRYKGTAAEQEALREEGLANGKLDMREADVQFWRAVYDEKINREDAIFKHFLDTVEALGLTGKTLFVLTSDHGTECFEHKRIDHGYTLYNELIHVPLIVKLPGGGSGVVGHQVSSIDVMPTVLELLDVPLADNIKKQLRGRSLIADMQGGGGPEDAYSETDYRLYTFKRSLMAKDGWKYIHTLENNGRELYYLPDDPGEMTNLVAKEPRRAYEMEQRVFGFFKSIGSDLTAHRWETGMNPVYDYQAKTYEAKLREERKL